MTNIHLSDLNYGVEIETENLGQEAAAKVLADIFNTEIETIELGNGMKSYTVKEGGVRTWKVVYDGSLRNKGAEIVSPVLNYYDIVTVQEIVRALKKAGASVPETCGCHIHVGFENSTAFQMANLIKIVDKQEEIIFKALGVTSSRRNSYCRDLDQELVSKCSKVKTDASLHYNAIDCPNPLGIKNLPLGRYHGLNVMAYQKHKTVEFRYFNGTLNADKIKAYIQFCLALVAYAKNAKKTKSGRRPFNPETASYDLRVFLTTLELNGDEYKTCREVMGARLHSDKAFKNGRPAYRIAA
jgi:hypothetical protein